MSLAPAVSVTPFFQSSGAPPPRSASVWLPAGIVDADGGRRSGPASPRVAVAASAAVAEGPLRRRVGDRAVRRGAFIVRAAAGEREIASASEGGRRRIP